MSHLIVDAYAPAKSPGYFIHIWERVDIRPLGQQIYKRISNDSNYDKNAILNFVSRHDLATLNTNFILAMNA